MRYRKSKLRKISTTSLFVCVSVSACFSLIACQSLNSQSRAADKNSDGGTNASTSDASAKPSDANAEPFDSSAKPSDSSAKLSDATQTSTASGASDSRGKNDPKLSSITSPTEFYETVWNLVNENYYRKKDIAETWASWRRKYDGKLESMNDAYKAVESMLGSLGDPQTHLRRAEEQKTQFGGIGVRLAETQDHQIFVMDPIYNGNAWKAGVKSGWKIMAVDDKKTADMTIDELVAAIRGPVGSKVKVQFFNGKATKDVELVREEIAIKATRAALKLDDNLGYIALDSLMPQSTPAEFYQAVSSLKDTDGLILDVRDNTGTGKDSFLHAVDILNCLATKKGVAVKVVDSNNEAKTISTNGKPLYEKPLAVLINKKSGQTSELLAKALQSLNGIKLIGERTAGDCTLQTSWECGDGRTLFITTGRMYDASGEDWNRRGIEPDVEVAITEKNIEKGQGPWWSDFPGQKSEPTPSKQDKQLAKAIETLTSQKGSSSPH